jgi:low temperature requirement protein LtrA
MLGALLDPFPRQVLWLGVIALDLAAGWLSGNRRPAGIHPRHFAERHGLIVIIALGESMIVTASSLSAHAGPSTNTLGGIALVVTCLLWWTYFGWVKDVLEEKLVELDGDDRARLARDAYTLWHFPLVWAESSRSRSGSRHRCIRTALRRGKPPRLPVSDSACFSSLPRPHCGARSAACSGTV